MCLELYIIMYYTCNRCMFLIMSNTKTIIMSSFLLYILLENISNSNGITVTSKIKSSLSLSLKMAQVQTGIIK